MKPHRFKEIIWMLNIVLLFFIVLFLALFVVFPYNRPTSDITETDEPVIKKPPEVDQKFYTHVIKAQPKMPPQETPKTDIPSPSNFFLFSIITIEIEPPFVTVEFYSQTTQPRGREQPTSVVEKTENKFVGDEFTIKTPVGETTVKILEIKEGVENDKSKKWVIFTWFGENKKMYEGETTETSVGEFGIPKMESSEESAAGKNAEKSENKPDSAEDLNFNTYQDPSDPDKWYVDPKEIDYFKKNTELLFSNIQVTIGQDNSIIVNNVKESHQFFSKGILAKDVIKTIKVGDQTYTAGEIFTNPNLHGALLAAQKIEVEIQRGDLSKTLKYEIKK